VAPPPEQVRQPAPPVERVAPAVKPVLSAHVPPAKPVAPERAAPPVKPGPLAPAHKTKLPRLKKP
jgi:hypothetical protein